MTVNIQCVRNVCTQTKKKNIVFKHYTGNHPDKLTPASFPFTHSNICTTESSSLYNDIAVYSASFHLKKIHIVFSWIKIQFYSELSRFSPVQCASVYQASQFLCMSVQLQCRNKTLGLPVWYQGQFCRNQCLKFTIQCKFKQLYLSVSNFNTVAAQTFKNVCKKKR